MALVVSEKRSDERNELHLKKKKNEKRVREGRKKDKEES